MSTTKKNTRKDNSNILLALMFIIIIILLVYIIFFTGGNGKTEFYSETLKFQNTVSSYLGKAQADMFGAYEAKNIIIGYNDEGTEIKNVDDSALTPIADKDVLVEKNNKKYYKLNEENIEKILEINVPVFTGIDWYICEDGSLAVKFTGGKPKWWSDNFEDLKLS